LDDFAKKIGDFVMCLVTFRNYLPFLSWWYDLICHFDCSWLKNLPKITQSQHIIFAFAVVIDQQISLNLRYFCSMFDKEQGKLVSW